ncbi:NEAT domain-containing protein [Sporosarcina sp. E16_8]|uniref:NEAT domain-containing protein n=1 Tax=Sporosarcina sp. E16_8 TaxID=2789295 RepID=UPI001A917CD5|nr:NEAT domain-containing protein [Sporosarcina sp. E16_8]MBO0588583.1 NEAT domain-containing protein [Sporosarcina sp. E16_8]
MKKNTVFTTVILFALFTLLPSLAIEKAAAASNFADGEYSVPFTVLKDTGNEQSTTAEYMVSPAKVIVQNNKIFAVVTLNNSSWWQYFKVQAGGGFADVQVLSNDKANDKRVVKFEVKDIEQLVNAKIHVIVTGIPGFTYDNKYDIRFKFNSSTIPLAPVAEKPATPPASKPTPKPVQPTPKPTPKPAVTEKAIATPKAVENKQAVTKVETKTEAKSVESKEVTSEKSDTLVEEKSTEPTEPTEQAKDEAKSEISEEELVAEDQAVAKEESSEVTKEAIDAEVEADLTSESNSKSTLLIVIFSVLILGGAIIFAMRQRTRTEK